MLPILRYSREKHGASFEAIVKRHRFDEAIPRSWARAVVAERYLGYARLIDYRLTELTLADEVEATIEFRFFLNGREHVYEHVDFIFPWAKSTLDKHRLERQGGPESIDIVDLTPRHYASMLRAQHWKH